MLYFVEFVSFLGAFANITKSN